MSNGFQRTIFSVPVALAAFLTQIAQHDTTRTRNVAHLAVKETLLSTVGFGKAKPAAIE
jgi:hypothetical protein